MSLERPTYINLASALERFSFEKGERIPEVLKNGKPNTITFREVKEILKSLPEAKVKPEVCAYWINTGPYESLGGERMKSQQCSYCYAVYTSSGNTPWPNHKYCAECGARMDGEHEENL